ncbi:MAG: prepilin-type N-terminal cleavage/methylation domain-containing protein [Candidatus Staskawiczbacteria bacterium]|nr:prepilin-type N-terminal cleavage/methylation domain-containing protein [Candidatus Staskawiczbacteria bacterium]
MQIEKVEFNLSKIKMFNKKQKGFTIIELLVVVAIIAVLAAIVLVNVTQYINKGKDAAIKGNMATILTNMAVWYDQNGSYAGFDAATNPGYDTPADAIVGAGKTIITGEKTDTSSQICGCATLYDTTNGTYCVDSTGYKKATATACASRCADGILAGSGTCSD